MLIIRIIRIIRIMLIIHIIRIISIFFLFLLFVLAISFCKADDKVPKVNWDASKDPEQVYFPNKLYLEYKNRYSPKCDYDEYCPTSIKEESNGNTSDRSSNNSNR